MVNPVPIKPERLPQHEDIPPQVRAQVQAINALAGRIARALGTNAAMPAIKAQAKAELVALARDALSLRGDL